MTMSDPHIRTATVAETIRAMQATKPADRQIGAWFFPLYRLQERDDVIRWLTERGLWEGFGATDAGHAAVAAWRAVPEREGASG
jgi:hypothetical protein